MVTPQSQGDAERGFTLFVPFAQALLANMKVWIASEGVFPTLHQQVLFGDKHTYRRQYEVKPDYFSLLASHYDDPCWQQEEVVQYAQMLWAESPLYASEIMLPDDPASPTPEQLRTTLFNELVFPLRDVLEHYETCEPSLEQLRESYARFREVWTAQSIRWEVSIPLLNFTSELRHQQRMGSMLFLAPFSPEEKTAVWNRSISTEVPMRSFVDFSAYQQTHFQLVGSYTAPRNVHGSFEIAAEVEDIITALRLIKPGDVRALAFFHKGHTPSTIGMNIFMNVSNESRLLQFGSLYTFTEADLSTFNTIFQALQRLSPHTPRRSDIQKPHGDLTVAMRRFNQAYNRNSREDQIIDLSIALESSLLADVRDELKYRLAVRGAALLANGRSPWEPRKSRALLQVMYDARSGIVHNGQQLADLEKELRKLQSVGIQPQEFPQQCEDIVRDILKAYVLRRANGQSLTQINQELEDVIVARLVPPIGEEMPY